jgi:SAM-dependent methyltransferase
MPKKIKPAPDSDEYLKKWTAIYEAENYDAGLAGRFLKKSHALAEKAFGPDVHFKKVLEVGAGTGVHLRYIRHTFDEYWLTDLNAPMLEQSVRDDRKKHTGNIIVQQENAALLSFADNSFDRLIATHVLEHLYKPHEVLEEWARVVKPGGIISLVLPCDPGMAWRLGRYAGSRDKFIRAGIDYDYWMSREHVNPLNNLLGFIRYYFDDLQESWWPLGIKSIDFNLFYIVHIRL